LGKKFAQSGHSDQYYKTRLHRIQMRLAIEKNGDSKAGLPDGKFSNQKSQFGSILEGLAMQDVVIFMAIWSILRPLGTFRGPLVYLMAIWYLFSRFGTLYQKNLATLLHCSIESPVKGSKKKNRQLLFKKIGKNVSQLIHNSTVTFSLT
jgi:hypothetical protein